MLSPVHCICIGPISGLSNIHAHYLKKYLVAYWTRYPGTEQSLKAWPEDASLARWQTPQNIKNQCRNASVVWQNQVVFNIKGNDRRLFVAIANQFCAIYIKFIGTHAEYNRIDAVTINME